MELGYNQPKTLLDAEQGLPRTPLPAKSKAKAKAFPLRASGAKVDHEKAHNMQVLKSSTLCIQIMEKLDKAQKKVYSIFQDGAQLKQFEIDAGPECKDRQLWELHSEKIRQIVALEAALDHYMGMVESTANSEAALKEAKAEAAPEAVPEPLPPAPQPAPPLVELHQELHGAALTDEEIPPWVPCKLMPPCEHPLISPSDLSPPKAPKGGFVTGKGLTLSPASPARTDVDLSSLRDRHSTAPHSPEYLLELRPAPPDLVLAGDLGEVLLPFAHVAPEVPAELVGDLYIPPPPPPDSPDLLATEVGWQNRRATVKDRQLAPAEQKYDDSDIVVPPPPPPPPDYLLLGAPTDHYALDTKVSSMHSPDFLAALGLDKFLPRRPEQPLAMRLAELDCDNVPGEPPKEEVPWPSLAPEDVPWPSPPQLNEAVLPPKGSLLGADNLDPALVMDPALQHVHEEAAAAAARQAAQDYMEGWSGTGTEAPNEAFIWAIMQASQQSTSWDSAEVAQMEWSSYDMMDPRVLGDGLTAPPAKEKGQERARTRSDTSGKVAKRALLVHNFPRGVTNEQMQAELEKYGEITMVNLQFDADGAARCFGFVNFATPEGAQAAKEAMDARQVHMESSDGKSSGWWVKADWAKCDASGLHKSRQQKGRGNKPRLPVNEDGATPTEDQPAEDQQPRRPGDEVGFAPLVDKERMRAVDQARPDARAAGKVTSEYFPPPPPPTSKENGEVAEPAKAPPARTGDAGKDGKKLRSNRKPSGRRRRNSE